MVGSLYPSSKYLTILLSPTFTRQKSVRWWRTDSIYRQKVTSINSSGLIKSEDVFVSLWWINYFAPYNHFSSDKTAQTPSLLYRYFYGKCSHKLYFLVLPIVTFTANTRPVRHFLTKHPHFLRISLVRNKFHSNSFFPRTISLWRGCFLITTILACSSLWSILISPI